MSDHDAIYPEDRVSAQTSLAPLCFRILLMSALAPVFCPGCSDPDPAFAGTGNRARTATYLSVSAPGAEPSGIRSLDLFFYNDDKLQRLDAYQRMEGSVLTAAVGASRSGNKILAVLANQPPESYDWASAGSLEALRSQSLRLKEEDPAHPRMSALLPVRAGTPAPVTLLSPLARIEVSSLRCDFSERTYRDEVLRDVRIYLTNVNAGFPLLCDTVPPPREILHAGRLKPADLADFQHPGMLVDTLPQPVGLQPCHPGTVLYCYPNAVAETGPGAPPTRLVVEGKLQGKVCYYPLDIGRTPDSDAAVLPGRTYRYDLTFTRRGSDDPEDSLEPGAVLSTLNVIPWTDRGETVIPF
ncbi:MAG: hypothetical protein IJ578_02080 [Bacteroidales bacterium]|nr:hypothetical protein [Bacteroidales bacterium]